MMLIFSNFWVRFAMFFLSGLSQIKNSCSYVWLSECTSSPHKAKAFTYINIFDALPMVLTCFYFMVIGKNWMVLPTIFTVITFVALFLAYFCPESPRWLLVNGNSVEAIKVLNDIAHINKSNDMVPANAIFVEDPNKDQKNNEIASSASPAKIPRK